MAVAKLAGLVKISNEEIHDTEVNLVTGLPEHARRLTLGQDLDLGLLNGTGPPEPAGVISATPNVDARDLLTGIATAMGGNWR